MSDLNLYVEHQGRRGRQTKGSIHRSEAERVHVLRVSLKRLRAVLKLLRYFDEDRSRKLEEPCRPAARLLSGYRDRQIVQEWWSQRHAGAAPLLLSAPISAGPALIRASEVIRSAQGDMIEFAREHARDARGLGRALRRKSKALLYQLEALCNSSDETSRNFEKALKSLGECLGEVPDCHIVDETLDDLNPCPPDLDQLRSELRSSQSRLEQRSIKIAEPLYALKPRPWSKSLEIFQIPRRTQ